MIDVIGTDVNADAVFLQQVADAWSRVDGDEGIWPLKIRAIATRLAALSQLPEIGDELRAVDIIRRKGTDGEFEYSRETAALLIAFFASRASKAASQAASDDINKSPARGGA